MGMSRCHSVEREVSALKNYQVVATAILDVLCQSNHKPSGGRGAPARATIHLSYIITTRRMTFCELLKYWNGVRMA